VKFWFCRSIAFWLTASCLCAIPALAGVRTVGTFVYELTIASNIKEDFSRLPASVRGQAEATLAAANKTPTTYVLTLTADRIDSDGSAHVKVGFTNSLESGHGSAAVYARFNQFDATLTSDGRFLPKYDPNMQMTVGARGMSPPEEINNAKAEQMAPMFTDFNSFASGCAMHSHMKAGDVWQVTTQDQYGISRKYEFAVLAAAAGSGSGSPAVTMKGDFATATSTSTVNAIGHYDGVHGLVLDLHEEITYQNSPPSGVPSSGKSAIDYKLRPGP
jgi:hypothetical protein